MHKLHYFLPFFQDPTTIEDESGLSGNLYAVVGGPDVVPPPGNEEVSERGACMVTAFIPCTANIAFNVVKTIVCTHMTCTCKGACYTFILL